MDKESLKKFKDLYETLFNSSSVEEYKLHLEEIKQVISRLSDGTEYFPSELLLMESDFPFGATCQAYVCVSTHQVISFDGIKRVINMTGSVLARQNQWDRDKYLNIFPISEYVAGGPLEAPEQRICWFPIYRQEDLRKAINFMLEMSKVHIIANLSSNKEGFLD